MKMGDRFLGLDIGEVRIGVAVSDELGMIASPVQMIPRKSDVARELRVLVERYKPSRLVAGLPTGLSGKEGPQAKATRERMSSSIAEAALISQGTRREKRKQHVDAMAAAIILQGYLDNQRWKTNRKR